MRLKPRSVLLSSLAVALLASALAAASAPAAAWKFNGNTLAGSETVVSHALESTITVPGIAVTCKPFVYVMTVSNSGGSGKGSLTKMPLSNCSTNTKACTVSKIEAQALPWAAAITTVSTSNYLVIEGIKLGILFAGAECVLNETEIVVKGKAGALVENAVEGVTFSPSSFLATGTSLGAGTKWTGSFRMLATETLIGQSISVS